ncbi:MAG TPA: ABC transporter substrate-binding protein [Pyrinomonadaceae bacterium]|jgi:ABC-type branched-subunit amino acid transport system substrate-binding protein
MRARCRRLKLTLTVLASLAVFWLAFGGRTGGAQGEGARRELSPQEKRGKLIYLKGESSDGAEIKTLLGSDKLEVPANAFACANCHGLRGQGTQEGGLQPPPINWETLVAPHTSPLTRRERPPYTEATLSRAIIAGLDSSGGRLHPGMPQYALTTAQMADLIAYLKRLGKADDADPGIDDKRIKVGAALPLTGALAQVGEDVRATLTAYFAEVNAQGGIYGRQIDLVVVDSRGEPAGTLAATERLVEQEGVFALVSSFEAGAEIATNDYLKRSEVALVGPVTLSPRLSVPPNPFVFYLLPTFNDQARTLVDFAATKFTGRTPRIAIISSENEFDADARAGALAQAKLYPMQIVAEETYGAGGFRAEAFVGMLAQKKPDGIFFFGNAEAFAQLTRGMEAAKLTTTLFSSVVMIGHSAFDAPASLAPQIFLAYPAALPGADDFTEFVNAMRKADVKLTSPAFQSVAYGAAKTFIEATKLSGRQLSRAALITSLEGLRDFKTGVVPPLTFGANRRVGASGSYIVSVDLNKKQYVPTGARLVPKEKK